MVIGLGGLGIPALQYLSGSGVGHLGIVDFDYVEKSNLSRQPFYFYQDVGRLKTEVVEARMKTLNPLVGISVYPIKVDLSNILDLLNPFDLVIDATDNFRSKFLIHDAAYLLRKKIVQAALYQYEGLLRSFDFTRRFTPPCLRCLWEDKPEAEKVKSCQEAGIVPATAGIIGSYQVMVALRLLLNWNHVIENFSEELYLDFRSDRMSKVRWKRRENCKLCQQKNLHNIEDQLKEMNKK